MLVHHMDTMHFETCPICEKVFLRSFEKRNHIAENHKESSISEKEFQQNVERQSTLVPDEHALKVQFVDEVDDIILDKITKIRRRGTK